MKYYMFTQTYLGIFNNDSYNNINLNNYETAYTEQAESKNMLTPSVISCHHQFLYNKKMSKNPKN